MKDDFLNFVTNGMTPQDLKEFAERLPQALEALREQIQKGDDEMPYGPEEQAKLREYWKRKHEERFPPEPEVFDVYRAQAELKRLSDEHEGLFQEPSRHYTRMQDIQSEMAALRQKIAQHQAQDEAARVGNYSDELSKIERDIQTLTAQSEKFFDNPSNNQKGIAELQAQIAQREARRNDILSGKVEEKLEWNNEHN